MKPKRPYTISFNETRQVWIASYRNGMGEWKTKWLSKTFKRQDRLDAERDFIGWYNENVLGEKPKTSGSPAGKTLALLAPKWLENREENPGTSPNTYNSFALSMRNWILDNPSFPHHSIQDLDIETELTVPELRKWILSLRGAAASKMVHIGNLKSCFHTCIAMNWLDENMVNPLDKPALQELIRDLINQKSEGRPYTYFSPEHIAAFFTGQHEYFADSRKVKYVLVLTEGLRDAEVQGLTWRDVDFANLLLSVTKQLEQAGHTPLLDWRKLVAEGKSKKQIRELTNAVSRKPKTISSVRTLPLHDLTAAVLAWWFKTGWKRLTGFSPGKDDPVFPRSNRSLKRGQKAGSFCYADSAEQVRDDCDRLEVSPIFTDKEGEEHNLDFHALRHTFAHLLEEAGVSDEHIGVLMGHSSKTVARANYLGKNLPLFRGFIQKLAVPERVVLSDGTVIKAAKR